MSDHPEFPQATAEMKYVVDQVSKIEDAQACGTGYYRTLKDVLRRIERLDATINELAQTTKDLKTVTNSNAVATVIGNKSDEIKRTLHEDLVAMSDANIGASSRAIRESLQEGNVAAKELRQLIADVSASNQELQSQIQLQNNCLIIPSWQAWLYILITGAICFVVGLCM